MSALPKIIEENGRKAVSARELYQSLGLNKAVWSRWYKTNITENGFAMEGEDWVGFNTMLNGNETQDFTLSIDFAKKLAMLARTERGEQIRNYFIQCEKVVQQTIQQPVSMLDMIEMTARVLREQEAKLNELNSWKSQMEEARRENIQELRKLPLIEGHVPDQTAMSKCRQIANRIAFHKHYPHQELWNSVYDTLLYRFHISIRAYKKIREDETYLQVAERNGFTDKILVILSEMARKFNLEGAA